MQRICGRWLQRICGRWLQRICGKYLDNNTTSWPILQDKTCQIFSLAEISRWAECGNNSFSLTMTLYLFTIYLKQSWKKLSTPEHKLSYWFWLLVCSSEEFDIYSKMGCWDIPISVNWGCLHFSCLNTLFWSSKTKFEIWEKLGVIAEKKKQLN